MIKCMRLQFNSLSHIYLFFVLLLYIRSIISLYISLYKQPVFCCTIQSITQLYEQYNHGEYCNDVILQFQDLIQANIKELLFSDQYNCSKKFRQTSVVMVVRTISHPICCFTAWLEIISMGYNTTATHLIKVLRQLFYWNSNPRYSQSDLMRGNNSLQPIMQQRSQINMKSSKN